MRVYSVCACTTYTIHKSSSTYRREVVGIVYHQHTHNTSSYNQHNARAAHLPRARAASVVGRRLQCMCVCEWRELLTAEAAIAMCYDCFGNAVVRQFSRVLIVLPARRVAIVNTACTRSRKYPARARDMLCAELARGQPS